MKIDILSLDGTSAGSAELKAEIFGLEPREDLIARMVRYQLDKRRAGTHKAKGRAEIARTGKKMYKQKGTGNARHGSARVPQFRGGGRAFGPVVRSHAHDMPKKVRAAGAQTCAFGQGARRRHHRLRQCRDRRAEDQGAARAIRQARPHQRADHRRCRAAGKLLPRRPQHSRNRRAPGPGPECLRHSAPREARPHAKRRSTRWRRDSHELEIFRRCAPLRSDHRAGHHREGDARLRSRTR